MNFAALTTRVRVEGGFDTSGANTPLASVQQWINERYQDLVVTSQWQEEEISLGPTVANQSVYPVAQTVADLIALNVGQPGAIPGAGAPEYGRIGRREMWGLKSGTLRRGRAVAGVYSPSYDSTGIASIEIYPAPTTSGLAITGLAAMYPTLLANDNDTPVIPPERHQLIAYGAIATGLATVDERLDDAQVFEKMYEAGREELRREKNKRLSGGGPTQIRVAGYHF